MSKKRRILVLSIAMAGILTSCKAKASYEKAKVVVDAYQPRAYETAIAVKGNIEPVFEFTVTAEEYESKSYTVSTDEIEVEAVNVAVGDPVSAGTVMVSFKAGDIQEKLDEYSKRLEADKLLLEHYTKLSEIDKKTDYSEQIKSIKDSIDITSMYLAEYKAKLDSYNIVAEKEGVVSMLSQTLSYGYAYAGDNLVTVKYGTGIFTATVAEDYDFKVGDVYEATFGMAALNMELTGIEELGADEEGRPERRLTFKAEGDIAGSSAYQKMNIEIHKPVVNNVLYIPKSAVFSVGDEAYVYVLDDNDMRHAVQVKTGSKVDDYIVILDGIAEGEKVVTGE